MAGSVGLESEISSILEGAANVPPAWVLSERLSRCESSPLRDIFKSIDKPGVISFAGGLPDPDCFPDISYLFSRESSQKPGSLPDTAHELCQYGASNGEYVLRNWVAAYISECGVSVQPEQIIILSGSQQGIDLSAKLLVDKGTKVAVNYPTYLAALQSFTLFGASYQELTSHADNAYELNGSTVAYVNPTFSNPASCNMTLDQRKALASACDTNNTILIEDDAYRELFYDDCERRPVCSHLKKAGWIYLSSFSKTIAPGLRIGFMAVCEELLPYMIRLKQAADLHSSRLAQHCVISVLQQGNYQQRIEELRAHYKKKRDQFDTELKNSWTDIADWQSPEGGMFFWLKMKYALDVPVADLLSEALDQGVAFMPGEYFYPPMPNHCDSKEAEFQPKQNAMHQPWQMLRLNFTNPTIREAKEGLLILSDLIRNHIDVSQTPR